MYWHPPTCYLPDPENIRELSSYLGHKSEAHEAKGPWADWSMDHYITEAFDLKIAFQAIGVTSEIPVMEFVGLGLVLS